MKVLPPPAPPPPKEKKKEKAQLPPKKVVTELYSLQSVSKYIRKIIQKVSVHEANVPCERTLKFLKSVSQNKHLIAAQRIFISKNLRVGGSCDF